FGQNLSRVLPDCIEHSRLLYARDRAIGRTGLLDRRLALQIRARVLCERYAGMAPLLRAIVDQPILADVQESSASAAVPAIREALRDVFLEAIVLREGEHLLAWFQQLAIDVQVFRSQRKELPAAIMQNSYRAGEPQRACPQRDGAGVLGVA